MKLREAETERDALRTRLDDYLTAEAERVASTGDQVPSLHDGADLWRHGVTIADVTDDDGNVSEQKVRERVEAVTDGKDHLRADKGPRRPKPDLSQGSSGNQRVANPDRGMTMVNFLQKR